MYAFKRTEVKPATVTNPQDRYHVSVTKGGEPVDYIHSGRIAFIEEEVMRWKDAMHIHKWFTDDETDDVSQTALTYISNNGLRVLLEKCRDVINTSVLVFGGRIIADAEDDDTSRSVTTQPMVIEDTSTARRLLPLPEDDYSDDVSDEEYNEKYLRDVMETKDWIEAHLRECESGPNSGGIYYYAW